MPAETIVQLTGVEKQFGAIRALAGMTLSVAAREWVSLVGHNGAGKSTTLKMLTGMIEPSSGSATICGHDLQREPIEVKRQVGFVPESAAVFESLTGLEYLEMVATLRAMPAAALPSMRGAAETGTVSAALLAATFVYVRVLINRPSRYQRRARAG